MGLLDQFGSLSDQAKQYALNALARFGNGVGDTVSNIPGNAQKLAQGLLNLPQTARQDLGGLLDGSMNGRIAQALSTPQQANPNQWLEQGMNLAGMAPVGGLMAHTVYHGSPHKFDKFDMSKIGTGEGAQAYGHGLYFAESPEVAKTYAAKNNPLLPVKGGVPHISGADGAAGSESLAVYLDEINSPSMSSRMGKEKLVGSSNGFDITKSQYGSGRIIKRNDSGEIIGALQYVKMPNSNDVVLSNIYTRPDFRNKGVASSLVGELKNKFKNVQVDSNMTEAGGKFFGYGNSNLYKVDIPDEAIPRMLDWDKPLSEQAPEVQAAFAKMPRDPDVDLLQNMINQNATGGALVKSIAAQKADDSFGKQYATDLMRQQGIPGIRYLDGSSRTSGQGTSNFVLFDDQLPRILEINGQPTGLKPWSEDAKRLGLLK